MAPLKASVLSTDSLASILTSVASPHASDSGVAPAFKQSSFALCASPAESVGVLAGNILVKALESAGAAPTVPSVAGGTVALGVDDIYAPLEDALRHERVFAIVVL